MSSDPNDSRMAPVDDLPNYFSLITSKGALQDIMDVVASYFTGIPGATRPGQLGFQADSAASLGIGNVLNLPSMASTVSDVRRQDAIGTARKWIGVIQRLGFNLDASDQKTVLAIAEKVQSLPIAKIRALLKDQVGLPESAVNIICEQLGPDGGRRFDALMQLSPGSNYQFKSRDFEIASDFLRANFDEYGRNEQGMKMSDITEGIGAAMRSGRLRTYASEVNTGNALRAAAAAEWSDPATVASPVTTNAMSLAANKHLDTQRAEQTAGIIRAPSIDLIKDHFSEASKKTYDTFAANRRALASKIPEYRTEARKKALDTLFDTSTLDTGSTDKIADLSSARQTYNTQDELSRANLASYTYTYQDGSKEMQRTITYTPSSVESLLRAEATTAGTAVKDLKLEDMRFTGSNWDAIFGDLSSDQRRKAVQEHMNKREESVKEYYTANKLTAPETISDTDYQKAYEMKDKKAQVAKAKANEAIASAQKIRREETERIYNSLQSERIAAVRKYYETQGIYEGRDLDDAMVMLSMNEEFQKLPETSEVRWMYADDITTPMRDLYESASSLANSKLPKLSDDMSVDTMLSNLRSNSKGTEQLRLAEQLVEKQSKVRKTADSALTVANRDTLVNNSIEKIREYQQASQAYLADPSPENLAAVRVLEQDAVIEAYRSSLGSSDAQRVLQETASMHTAIMKAGRALPNWGKLVESSGGEGMLAENMLRKFTAGARSFDAPSVAKSLSSIGESAVRMNIDAQMLEPIAGATAQIIEKRGMSASANPSLMDTSLLYASSYLRNAISGNQLDTATALNMGVTAVDKATQTQAYKNTVALGSAEGEVKDPTGRRIQQKLQNGESLTAEEQKWLSKTDNVREALRTAGYNDYTMMALFDPSRVDVLRAMDPERADALMKESIAAGDQTLWQWHENQMASELDQQSDKIDAEQAEQASSLYFDVMSLTGDSSVALAVAGTDSDVDKMLKARGVSDEKIAEIKKRRAAYLTKDNSKDLMASMTMASANSKSLEGSMRLDHGSRDLESAINEGNAAITAMPFGTTSFTERNQDPNASIADIITSLIQAGITTIDGSDISKRQLEHALLFKTVELTQSSSDARAKLNIAEDKAESWNKQMLQVAKDAGVDIEGKTIDDIFANSDDKAKLLRRLGASITDEELIESSPDSPLAGNRVMYEMEKRKQEEEAAKAAREETVKVEEVPESIYALPTTSPTTSPTTTTSPEEEAVPDLVLPDLDIEPSSSSVVPSESTSATARTSPYAQSSDTVMSESASARVEAPVVSSATTVASNTSSATITSEELKQMLTLLSDLKTYLEAGQLKVQSTLMEA